VARLKRDDLHALGVASGNLDLIERRPDDDASGRDDHQVFVAMNRPHRGEFAILIGALERDNAFGAPAGETVAIVMAAIFGRRVFGIGDLAIA
jgi:hypothetical protein